MKPYKIPKGYLDFQSFDKHLALTKFVSPKPIDVLGMPDVPRNLSHIYSVWAQGYPLYCVRTNLLEQMLSTDVGENLALFSDINLAIPSYILFLPQHQIKSPSGKGYIDYLVINHDWKTKNKCKALGLHPEKDIQIVEYEGYNYAVVKNPKILFTKHPEFESWYKELNYFPRSGWGYDYNSFAFVSHQEYANTKDSKFILDLKMQGWLLSVDVVKK